MSVRLEFRNGLIFFQLTETFSVEKVKEMLGDIVKECHGRALDQKKAEGHILLERGFATIPLPGIDVPFHSRYLWAGVMPFRTCEFLRVYCCYLLMFSRPFQKDRSYAHQSRRAHWQIYS